MLALPLLRATLVAAATTETRGAPTSWDWRTHGVVVPVRNQGPMGASPLDALTDAIAAAIAIATTGSKVPDLEPATVLKCTKTTCGPSGMDQDCIYQYAQDHGFCEGKECECASPHKLASTLKIPPNDEDALKSAVLKGVVAVFVEADQPVFEDYRSGVLDAGASCGVKINHGLVLTGFGTENGKDYWVLKNSWGVSWGQQGFILLKRGSSTGTPGECGVTLFARLPIGKVPSRGPALDMNRTI